MTKERTYTVLSVKTLSVMVEQCLKLIMWTLNKLKKIKVSDGILQ